MPSKEQDVKTPKFSQVLFVTVDGEPMNFFLRPGPTKRKIQPLIKAGGGILCHFQQPGAILLIDPEELSCIPETVTHWYVSTQYIHDCTERDEQLNLEDYRLNPEVAPKKPARLSNTKDTSLTGRAAYTAEEDALILSHVSKHKTDAKGNRLWQDMEKQKLTSHSWQSMKYRYRVRLSKLQTEDVKVAAAEKEMEAAEKETEAAEKETEAAEKGTGAAEKETGAAEKETGAAEKETEAETEVEENQEASVQKPSSAEDAASPPTDSAETDSTQIDAELVPSDSTQPEIVEAQTSISPEEEEVQHVDPQTDEQPSESPQAETAEVETSEGTCVDLHTDAHADPAESAEEEVDDSQTIISSKEESVPEDSPPAQPESMPDTPSKKKSREKQKASPVRVQPPRRFTRRQLVLEEPYAKRPRSSTSSPGGPPSSPEPSKKTKSVTKSAPLNDKTAEQPPSKRARGESVAESLQEESEQAAVPETQLEDTESDSVPQKAEKKKEKRKLGILELATKEFEDDSEISDEELTPDLQTATVEPTSAQPPLPTSNTAAEAAATQSNPQPEPQPVPQPQPQPEPGLQENTQETPASSSSCPPQTGGPEPAAPEAVTATSKAHLFIFDRESQVEDSQSIVGDTPIPPSNPQQTEDKDPAPSLTQVQLEEDMQWIRDLMNKTKQNLASVTKALLRTSGDFSAALDQLLNPLSTSGPHWTRQEDTLLLSADPLVRLQLQEKYSEEDVAKRIVFLEVDG